MSKCPDDLRIEHIGLGRHPERHPQEVLHQRSASCPGTGTAAPGLLVGVRRDGGQLGQQPDRGELDLFLVQRVERIRVVGAQRIDRTGEHRIGCVAREAIEEPLEVLVQHGVPLDLVGKGGQLLGGRQLTVDEQVGDLDEGRLLGQLLDRVSAIPQDAGVAVDVGDRRLGGRGVDESAVEGGVAGLGQQGVERDRIGALGRLDDVEVDRSPGILRVAVSSEEELLATETPSERYELAIGKVVANSSARLRGVGHPSGCDGRERP